jgi:hypothetical protein
MGLKPVLGNPLGGVVDVTDLEEDKVPYTGATADVDLGRKKITANDADIIAPLYFGQSADSYQMAGTIGTYQSSNTYYFAYSLVRAYSGTDYRQEYLDASAIILNPIQNSLQHGVQFVGAISGDRVLIWRISDLNGTYSSAYRLASLTAGDISNGYKIVADNSPTTGWTSGDPPINQRITTLANLNEVVAETQYSFYSPSFPIWASNVYGTNTGDQDLSGLLNIDQTTPQTTVGTFTFPQIKDSGLSASLGVYSDANKQLTSTPPTSGVLGYWSRTSPTLIPSVANDRVNVTIASTSTTGIPYAYNGAVTQSGSSDDTQGFDVIAGKFSTTNTFALTGIDVFAPAVINNYGVQNGVTTNAAHTRTLGDEGSAQETNIALSNLCMRGNGSPASSATITTPTITISNFAIANTCANYVKYNNAGGTITSYNYGGHFSVTSAPTLTAGTMDTQNYGFYATVVSTVVGSTTSYGAYISVQGTGNTNWGYYNASTAASLAHNMFGTAGINSSFGTTATPSAKIMIGAGTATAGTAPIKFTSGTLTTAAVAGQMEYLTNDFYLTSATGTREKIATSVGLTSGRVPYVTTNGRLTDSAGMTFNGTTLNVLNFNAVAYENEAVFYENDMVFY